MLVHFAVMAELPGAATAATGRVGAAGRPGEDVRIVALPLRARLHGGQDPRI
jgi:hypothetical protein